MKWFPTRTRTSDVMHLLTVRFVEERRIRGKTDDQIIQELINT